MANNQRIDFLYLSEPDMIKAGVMDIEKCVNVVEESFHLLGKGDYLMGGPKGNEHGQMIWFPEKPLGPNMPVKGPDRRFMSMIAYLGGRFNICGEKWYGSNIENTKKGLPRSILQVILNDPDTAAPLAFMSANLISAMRTGAVPGVAAKYLAKKDSKTLGVIGGGVISKTCLLAINTALENLEKVVICDINYEKAKQFADEMSKEVDCKFVPTDQVEEAVVDADVISVATSGPKKARIEKEWLKEGVLLTLTGPADMDDECLIENRIVADNWKMHEAWREEAHEHPDGVYSIMEWAPTGQLIKLTIDNVINDHEIDNLGDITLGKVAGRKSDNEKIILVTGGMPIHDVAWAYEIYKNAKEKGIGTTLNLWDKPFLY